MLTLMVQGPHFENYWTRESVFSVKGRVGTQGVGTNGPSELRE